MRLTTASTIDKIPTFKRTVQLTMITTTRAANNSEAHWPAASSVERIEAGCKAVTPARSLTWWRQETPDADSIVPGSTLGGRKKPAFGDAA